MQSHRPPSYSASPTTGNTNLIHATSRQGTPRKRTRQPTQHPQKPVGPWSRLSPTPIKTASWKDVKELRHAPAPTRRGPPQNRRDQKPPRCHHSHHLPQILKPPPAKTPWRQRKKESRNPLRRAAVCGKTRRATISAEGPLHRRRRAAPLRKTQGG